jgi:hypothetical protein
MSQSVSYVNMVMTLNFYKYVTYSPAKLLSKFIRILYNFNLAS